MIDAIPLHPLHLDFEFREGEREVGEMKSSGWRARAEVMISAKRYPLFHEGLFRGDFCRGPGPPGPGTGVDDKRARGDDFSLEFGAGRLTLQRGPAAERRFGVFDGEREVGRIARDGPVTRQTRIDLPRALAAGGAGLRLLAYADRLDARRSRGAHPTADARTSGSDPAPLAWVAGRHVRFAIRLWLPGCGSDAAGEAVSAAGIPAATAA